MKRVPVKGNECRYFYRKTKSGEFKLIDTVLPHIFEYFSDFDYLRSYVKGNIERTIK